MADEQREVARYVFEADISDLEAKARRASELATGTDRAGRSLGKSDPLADLGPLAGFPSLAEERAKQDAADQAAFIAWRARAGEEEQQTKRNSSATAELIQHKRGLVSVIGLLGGSFGGLASHILNFIALAASASGALVGWIGAAAGLTVLVQWLRKTEEAARAAAAAQGSFNDAVTEAQSIKQGRVDTLAEQLEGWGRRTPQTIAAGEEIQQKLGETYGVVGDRGTKAAGLAASLNLGVEDAARMAVLLGAGAQIGDPDQAAKALSQAREKGLYDALLQEADAFARDEAGQNARILASAPMWSGKAGSRAAQKAFEGLQKQPGGLAGSGMPPDLTLAEFSAAATTGDIKELARELYPGMKKAGAQSPLFQEVANLARLEMLSRSVHPIAQGYVERAEAILAGTAPRNMGMFSSQTPELTPDQKMLLAMGFSPGPGAGQAIKSLVDEFNKPEREPAAKPARKERDFRFDFGRPGAGVEIDAGAALERELIQRLPVRGGALAGPGAPGAGGGPVVVNNIGEVHNYGTVYQDTERRRKRHNFDFQFGAGGGADPRSPL